RTATIIQQKVTCLTQGLVEVTRPRRSINRYHQIELIATSIKLDSKPVIQSVTKRPLEQINHFCRPFHFLVPPCPYVSSTRNIRISKRNLPMHDVFAHIKTHETN